VGVRVPNRYPPKLSAKEWFQKYEPWLYGTLVVGVTIPLALFLFLKIMGFNATSPEIDTCHGLLVSADDSRRTTNESCE
jgi:hypothetical protein